jgi:hypothetical protein
LALILIEKALNNPNSLKIMQFRFILASLLLWSGLASAQKNFILDRQPKRGFVTMSVGLSQPMGRFASNDGTNEQAGLAGRGISLAGSAGYLVAGPVGLAVRAEQSKNSLQAAGLLSSIYRQEGDTWTASAGNWTVTNVMAGPYITLPMGRLSVDVRAMAGRTMVVCPATSLLGQVDDAQLSIQSAQCRGQAMAYGAGISAQYRLGINTAIQVTADYTQSTVALETTTTSQSDTGFYRSQSATYTVQKPISLVSVSAGISILFGNRNRVF